MVSFFVSFSFSFWVCLALLKNPLTSPGTQTDTLGARLKPKASNTSFLASICASSSFYFSDLVPAFLFHLSQLTSSPAPACTFSPTPSQLYQPSVPGSPADDTDIACPPPSPLPVSWRQWWWQNRQHHPRPQGKGIGQAPGRELAQEEDLSWTCPRISPSWACPISSYWDSCTCNPHRTS